MTIKLTQKETLLLEDQKSHEELCTQKYTNYANQAQDQELKNLFNSYAQQERAHLDTINQILIGNVPQMNQGQGQNQKNQQHSQAQPANQGFQQNSAGFTNETDKNLCSDALTTEKYVSSTYDTTIFECTNSQVRKVLNHIQKEEQEHGKGIFDYMQNHGMYQVK